MQMLALAILGTPRLAMAGTAIAVIAAPGLAGIFNPGPHGFSEVFYAFTSAANNNGSAFAGLTVTSPFFQLSLATAMLLGRFVPMVLVIALAGRLARSTPVPASSGTLPTHTPLFISLLIGVIVLVSGLTFFPALALGPIAEALS
jgi:K+-transporting ATPase ATPase A chain